MEKSYKTRVKINDMPVYIMYRIYNKTVCYDLYYADQYDNEFFTAKKDCKLFRITSGKPYFLIVSINLDKNLLYFLKDYDNEKSEWNTKGIKLQNNNLYNLL